MLDHESSEYPVPAASASSRPSASTRKPSGRIGGAVLVADDAAGTDELVLLARRQCDFTVLMVGANFGNGCDAASLVRQLHQVGIRVIVAESFTAELIQACRESGDVYPMQCAYCIRDGFETGDCVEVDVRRALLRAAHGSAAYPLRSLFPAARKEPGSPSLAV